MPMYQPFTTGDGVEAVQTFLGEAEVQSDSDGLIFAPPQQTLYEGVSMSGRLLDWLVDIRLLKHIPLSYLVPDSALLPTESIRFFHVDPTWVERTIEGVFSAANTGTVDAVFGYGVLAMARGAVDEAVLNLAKAQDANTTWSPAGGMTGMLIRSELVRRWPDMLVWAWKDFNMSAAVPVLRAEPVARDIYIALFAGAPQMVTIREPFNGVRFGVEAAVANSQTQYRLDPRKTDGNSTGGAPITITWRNSASRTIRFDLLGAASAENSPRQVAINLEQKPFLQEFKQSIDEAVGSKELTPEMTQITFRKGRFMKLDALRARLEQRQKATGA